MAEGMEITIGMEAGFSRRPEAPQVLGRLATMGATSVETYCKWSDVAPAEGCWDWSLYDRDLEALRAAGLKWVPFLIAGPWYATPAWFRASSRSVLARCLEHERETGTQSIWSPHLFSEVQAFLAAFSDHYRPAAIESVLLGVTGDYGEAIFPVVGNWPGDYHGHPGHWCGDRYARDDFRRWLRARHPDLSLLAAHWGWAPEAWDTIEPPRSPALARTPMAWLDFVAWYRQAMTDWSARWLEEARRRLPGVALYLCTGGDMTPQHGSDFSEQCRVAAAVGAGVRITNEGSDYVQNLMLTRLVATAGRHHGAFYGFEPAARVDATGVAARQFNAISSGARQLHEYQGNILTVRDGRVEPVPAATEAWERGRPHLVRRRPAPAVALVYSLPDLALREAGITGGALALARVLRPLCDFAVLDDHLVTAGALAGMRAAVLAPARHWSPDVLKQLRAFAEAGGLVVAAGTPPIPLANTDETGGLFGFTPETEEVAGISAVVPADGAALQRVAQAPRLHLARGYRQLDPACRPLLRLAHEPAQGGAALVAWYRPCGAGAVAFYAGNWVQGEDWMSAAGMPQALLADLLTHLPTALHLAPVALAGTEGVYETPTTDGLLGWNAGDAAREWQGMHLPPWGMGIAADTTAR